MLRIMCLQSYAACALLARRIVKPVGQSRGRGIRLIRSARQLADGPGGLGTADDPLVVQRYVTNPMMVQVCLIVVQYHAWWCRRGAAGGGGCSAIIMMVAAAVVAAVTTDPLAFLTMH